MESLLAHADASVVIDGPVWPMAGAVLDPEPLLGPGQRVGAYQIVTAVGAGGMGVVYRARDTRLQRDVALKVLPAAFSDDPERLARFRREAHVLASLNHPNVAAIHGFEDAGDVHALVLELVNGPILLRIQQVSRDALQIQAGVVVIRRYTIFPLTQRNSFVADRLRMLRVNRMITPVSGLFEAHLPVADLATSIAFYRDQAGLELAHVVPTRQAAFFWIGSRGHTMLGLWAAGFGPQKMTMHIAFTAALADVIAAPRALQATGIPALDFDGQPTDEPVVLAWMPAASVFFRDPDGHLLEYIAMLAEEARPEDGVVTWREWTRAGRTRAIGAFAQPEGAAE